MTPCVARDGALAVADDERCVGCDIAPYAELRRLCAVMGREVPPVPSEVKSADLLRDLIAEYVELKERPASND